MSKMRMCSLVRYAGSFCISGMRSRRTIDTGTVQYGLKLTSTILLLISGDGRSGLPTTAVWRETATPFSTASICAAGMLQTTKRLARWAVRLRSRAKLVLSCASRTSHGMLSRSKVSARTMPSTVMPWRAWKRRTAAST